MEQHAVSRLERNIEQSLVDVFAHGFEASAAPTVPANDALDGESCGNGIRGRCGEPPEDD